MSFKPDASFVRYIAVGAVGSRAVVQDLHQQGHQFVSLENGSTDTKLWKDVKRKRVRIPDLVCLHCGLRVESRAKTASRVAMSHSDGDAERAWDYGMVGGDVLAFPIVKETDLGSWGRNDLHHEVSSYMARELSEWSVQPTISYFSVFDLRSVPPSTSSQKGVTEGSETTIEWDVVYSSRDGVVERIEDGRVSVRRNSDQHLYTWQNKKELPVRVQVGDIVRLGQVLASGLTPLGLPALDCNGGLTPDALASLVQSPERTQRFTGYKLARLRNDDSLEDLAQVARDHPEEDLYVSLEAATYLASVLEASPRNVFSGFLTDPDPQTQLEATLALSEAGTDEAVEMLGEMVLDVEAEYFQRAAAAWGLGQVGTNAAAGFLLEAFQDLDNDLREEALQALSELGGDHTGLLVQAVSEQSGETAAGAAEVLRRLGDPGPESVEALVKACVEKPEPVWEAWLLGALDPAALGDAAAELQATSPQSYFAILVVRAFMQSWVAGRWSLVPTASYLGNRDQS